MKPNNLTPLFDKPKHHKARPAFLRACGTNLGKNPLSKWVGWQLIQHNNKQSKVYQHAHNAMDALAMAIVHFTEIQSGCVNANVSQLAELTGLITESEAGNISISRASRAIIRMIDADLLEAAPLVWDKQLGYWLPKFINVTDKFWDVVHPEGLAGYEKARAQQYAYQCQGVSTPKEWLSITEAKERRRRTHIKTIFEYRKSKQSKAKERRLSRKLQEKDRVSSRAQITQQILNELGDCSHLTHQQLDVLVSKRMGLYRKIADDPDPPRHKAA